MKGVNVLLVNVSNGTNLGMIVRTNYVAGGNKSKLFIFDPNSYLISQKDEFEHSSKDIKEYTLIKDLRIFLKEYYQTGGRIIASDIGKESTPSLQFNWLDGDLILFGNERKGYEMRDNHELWPGMEYVTHKVVIEMLGNRYDEPHFKIDRGVLPVSHGKFPQYNVAIAHAMLLRDAFKSTGIYQNFVFNY